MKLHQNWLTEGLMDFEYKKYLLLAYLQEVNLSFDEKKLYPHLGELLTHYRNILEIKKSKEEVRNNFPKRVSGIDLQNFKVEYEKMINDSSVMKEIESIIDYSTPKLEAYVKSGKEIYDHIENRVNIETIGVLSLYTDEGYMLLKNGNKKETRIYEYQITIFDNSEEQLRGIRTSYITSMVQSVTMTFEQMKSTLIKERPQLKNPATYLAETDIKFPLQESLLPIAKRCLVKYIASAA